MNHIVRMKIMRSRIAVGSRQQVPIRQAEKKMAQALTTQNPHWYVDEDGNCPRCLDYQLKLADPELQASA